MMVKMAKRQWWREGKSISQTGRQIATPAAKQSAPSKAINSSIGQLYVLPDFQFVFSSLFLLAILYFIRIRYFK
jgi:hypothetical protein